MKSDIYGLDVNAVATEAMEGSGFFSKRVMSFENILIPKLISFATNIKLNSRFDFAKQILETAIAEIAFVGFENDVPHISSRRFFVREDTNGTITVAIDRFDCPGPNCPQDPLRYTLLGSGGQDAMRIARGFSAMWANWTPAHVAHFLLEQEIRADSDEVGPPIAIREITRSGTQWIERGACP